jgi:coenzyme F420-0:L-glutamate ligase / coenzyme F420-1:gamma-L-glutamate ligase
MSGLSARSLTGIPEVRPGDDLAALIVGALGAEAAPTLCDGQVVAIAHKAVSKAEGAVVALADVEPSARARELAAEQGRDPRAVQVVLDQSREVLRATHGVLICRTHHGFVCANAGVDASNAGMGEADARGAETGKGGSCAEADAAGGVGEEADTLIVLPRDPDASARRLRARLRELTGAAVAVLITDSFGRAWRHGQCDVALGCAGMSPLDDWRGRRDGAGRELSATWLAVADAAAAAADLARAKDSHEPVVIVEGLERFVTAEDGPGAAALLRPLDEDLFR